VPDIAILIDRTRDEAGDRGRSAGETKLGLRLSYSDAALTRLDAIDRRAGQASLARNRAAASSRDRASMATEFCVLALRGWRGYCLFIRLEAVHLVG